MNTENMKTKSRSRRCDSMARTLDGAGVPLRPLARGQLFQQLGDLVPCRSVASPCRAASELHHHVHASKAVTEPAERLAHQPLRAVAIDRPRRYPLARD